MTKKFIVMLALLVGLVSNLSAGVNVPYYDYGLVESRDYGAYQLYKKRNDSVYVAVVDLQKADVSFKGYQKASSKNSFKRYKLSDWWRAYNWRTYAIFNGQFFNRHINPTPLSFPLRAQWKTVVTQVDPGRSLKTLKIYSNGKEAQIYDGYSSYYLRNSKELIVGLDPSENMQSNKKVGRFYIGGLHENSSSIRYLLFFISDKKTQSSMLNEIYKWGIYDQNIVMMDGSGSAQMKTNRVTIYGATKYLGYKDKRELPNVLLLRKK